MFIVTVHFLVNPRHVDDFERAVVDQARNSLAREPGCKVFDVATDASLPGSFYLYEKYTDAAAFQDHLQSAHFLSFDAAVAPWATSKSVTTWTEVDVDRESQA